MSDFKRKRRQVFLLSRLKPTDFLLLLMAAVLIMLVLIAFPRIKSVMSEMDIALAEYSDLPPREVSPRAIQMTNNVTYLWHKDDSPPSGENYKFFTPGQNIMVFPTGKVDRGAYQFWLTAVDMTDGSIRWQTETPEAYEIRIYDDKFFMLSPGGAFSLSTLSFPAASVLNNQELPYCSFGGSTLLSTYHLGSGELIWGYAYHGVSTGDLYFKNNQVFMTNTGDNGKSGLVAAVDIPSGQIMAQTCGRIRHQESNPAAYVGRGKEFGTPSVTMSATSKDSSIYESVCSSDGPYCFVTEGKRLDLVDTQTQQLLGYILFEGADLTHFMIRIVRQNQYFVVYFEDSGQLFGFRY